MTPLVKQTVDPETNNCEVEAVPRIAKLVVVTFVPVALVKVVAWKEAEPVTVRFVFRALVANKLVLVVLVPVALVQMRLVKVDGAVPATTKFVNEPLVANKFVVVTLVAVPFTNVRF